jgi:hygromycin-B 7''-O-kinase
MPIDYYIQPDTPDPVLPDSVVMNLVHRHLPEAVAVADVDENGGEARTYAIDQVWIFDFQSQEVMK